MAARQSTEHKSFQTPTRRASSQTTGRRSFTSEWLKSVVSSSTPVGDGPTMSSRSQHRQLRRREVVVDWYGAGNFAKGYQLATQVQQPGETMPTTTSFDLEMLRRGLEQRDPDAWLSVYADDAEVTEVDKRNPPAAPRVFRGKEAIGEHIREICAREMTHRLERPVAAEDRIAFTEACRYPDGTNVLCMATADLDSAGKIIRQVAVTAWDE